jgi:broad specificity phosphatase PhoE
LNASRVFQTADEPLSERGLRQAARLAERVEQLGVARVLSSDFARARMTADVIVARTGASLEETPLLQERNFGELRGRRYAEVGERVFAPDFEPPGGESWPVFERRVAGAFAFVVERYAAGSGNLAVVTHGMVCRSLTGQFCALPDAQGASARFGNTSLTLIEPEPPYSARLLACVAHLQGLDADDGSAPVGL